MFPKNIHKYRQNYIRYTFVIVQNIILNKYIYYNLSEHDISLQIITQLVNVESFIMTLRINDISMNPHRDPQMLFFKGFLNFLGLYMSQCF